MRIEWVKGSGFAVRPDLADVPFLEGHERGPWTFKTFEVASRFAEAMERKIAAAVFG
jgi:hypothetical protein